MQGRLCFIVNELQQQFVKLSKLLLNVILMAAVDTVPLWLLFHCSLIRLLLVVCEAPDMLIGLTALTAMLTRN